MIAIKAYKNGTDVTVSAPNCLQKAETRFEGLSGPQLISMKLTNVSLDICACTSQGIGVTQMIIV